MIAVITGTNREESTTSLVAAYCAHWLENKGYIAENIRLTDLNGLTVRPGQFSTQGMDEVVRKMRDEILVPSDHWILVLPEYNGSYPGILKWWIDLLSVYDRNQVFQGKKISLIGVASGRAGNLGCTALPGHAGHARKTSCFTHRIVCRYGRANKQ